MISISAAVTMLSIEVVAVALWGSFVGINSAQRGPGWAVSHLKRATLILLLAGIGGALLAAAVEPPWFGLATAYIAFVSFWIGRRVLRASSQDLGTPPPERVEQVLRSASSTLVLAGLVVSLIAVVDFVWRSWPALVDVALALALLVPGFVYRRRADQLQGTSTV